MGWDKGGGDARQRKKEIKLNEASWFKIFFFLSFFVLSFFLFIFSFYFLQGTWGGGAWFCWGRVICLMYVQSTYQKIEGVSQFVRLSYSFFFAGGGRG